MIPEVPRQQHIVAAHRQDVDHHREAMEGRREATSIPTGRGPYPDPGHLDDTEVVQDHTPPDHGHRHDAQAEEIALDVMGRGGEVQAIAVTVVMMIGVGAEVVVGGVEDGVDTED